MLQTAGSKMLAPPSPLQDRGVSARHNKFGTFQVKIEQTTERANAQHGKRSPQKKAAVTKFKGAHLLKWLAALCMLNCVGAVSEVDGVHFTLGSENTWCTHVKWWRCRPMTQGLHMRVFFEHAALFTNVSRREAPDDLSRA